jgi:hypothetical protein
MEEDQNDLFALTKVSSCKIFSIGVFFRVYMSISLLPKGDLRSPRNPLNSLSFISHQGDKKILQLHSDTPVERELSVDTCCGAGCALRAAQIEIWN